MSTASATRPKIISHPANPDAQTAGRCRRSSGCVNPISVGVAATVNRFPAVNEPLGWGVV
jgi:hypothetical protein